MQFKSTAAPQIHQNWAVVKVLHWSPGTSATKYTPDLKSDRINDFLQFYLSDLHRLNIQNYIRFSLLHALATTAKPVQDKHAGLLLAQHQKNS